MLGLVAKPVGLPVEGGHVGDRSPAPARRRAGDEAIPIPVEMDRPIARASAVARRLALRSALAVAAPWPQRPPRPLHGPRPTPGSPRPPGPSPRRFGGEPSGRGRDNAWRSAYFPLDPAGIEGVKAMSRRPLAASWMTSERLPVYGGCPSESRRGLLPEQRRRSARRGPRPHPAIAPGS